MASKELFSEQFQTKAETQRFTWKIPDVPTLVKGDQGFSLKNESFQMGASIGIPINFTCYLELKREFSRNPSYYRANTKPCLGFSVKLAELFRSAELAAKANASFTLEMESNTGNTLCKKNCSLDVKSLLKEGTIYFGYELINYIDPTTSRDLPQPEDDTWSVNLTATIFTVNDKPIVQLPSLVATFKERALQKRTQDFKMFFQEPGFKEDALIAIVCKDGTQFKVYRGILCARSPVFRTMFQTEMSEADSGQVRIEDIPSKALNVFLHFVDTGKLKDNWKELEILEDLTYAAHKYDVKDLFDFLDQSLGHLVNQENFGKLMNLAKKFGMLQAEKELMDYFKREVNSIEQAAQIIAEAMEFVLALSPEEPETRKQ